MSRAGSWSTQQLAEFLVSVSAFEDEASTVRGAVEHAAEALEAEIGAVVRGGEVVTAIGFAPDQVPHAALVKAAETRAAELQLPGCGRTPAIAADLEDEPPGRLLLARAGEPFSYEESNLLRGMGRALELHIRMLRVLERERALRGASEREVAQRRKAEDQLQHQALHDSLTGLPNRSLLLDRIERVLAHTRRYGSMVAVLFADLDNFKVINDGLGHAAGDHLLVSVAERLLRAIRQSDTVSRPSTDTVARLGGDEFVVLCDSLSSERDAVAVAERIAQELRTPFEVEGEKLFVSASIGIAPSTNGDATPESLLRDADAAMYRAKERGRARYEIFDEAIRDRVLGRLHQENQLRHAIEADELRLFYQPIISLRDHSVPALEALVRWEHPERGLLPPADFVPLAEESSLILRLGEWVLKEACRQVARWDTGAASGLRVTINFAARQLGDPALPNILSSTIEDAGIDPARIGVEITESSLIDEAAAPVQALKAMKDIGVQLILDDFGTGYSSLSYLQRLPLDILKLDRSFVTPLGSDRQEWKLVASVVDMANALDLTMVAEGVETAEQQQMLARLDCPYAQGYHFAKPTPAETISTWLLEHSPNGTPASAAR